jgi:predicted enzyme related to lactoylglutathione lyase
MISRVMRITLVVRSQDEAVTWYTEKLGFVKRADFPMGPNARWITVAPPDDTGIEMVLQPPDWFQGEERQRKIAQIGQNPTLVLRVNDCVATCAELQARGVAVAGPPERVPWGLQAVVKDLYGNDLVLLEPA